MPMTSDWSLPNITGATRPLFLTFNNNAMIKTTITDKDGLNPKSKKITPNQWAKLAINEKIWLLNEYFFEETDLQEMTERERQLCKDAVLRHHERIYNFLGIDTIVKNAIK